MIELRGPFLDMDEPSKMLKNSPCLNPKGVVLRRKIYEIGKKKWSTKYFLRVWLNLSIQAGSFGRCQALVTSSSSRGMLQGTWIHMKLGSLYQGFSEEKSPPFPYPPGKKNISHQWKKTIIWQGKSTISNIFCRLVFWFLRFVGSIFVVLLVWRSPFCFSSNDMRASFWRMAPRQASTVTNSWPKLGLQFVTGMTLLGNYYIVMFINQLRSGLIIPNSLVSCVMWMELVQELGVFKVSARFW